jgi:hypothetical protein
MNLGAYAICETAWNDEAVYHAIKISVVSKI